jgi:acyl carrier protein
MNEVTEKLVSFIQENLTGAHPDLVVDENTPLLERGILDSLKTAMLLNFIRDEIGTPIPPERLSTGHFRTPRDIAALVQDVALTGS